MKDNETLLMSDSLVNKVSLEMPTENTSEGFLIFALENSDREIKVKCALEKVTIRRGIKYSKLKSTYRCTTELTALALESSSIKKAWFTKVNILNHTEGNLAASRAQIHYNEIKINIKKKLVKFNL